MEPFIPKGNLRGFIMPDFVFKDSKLSLGAKTLYALLCTYAGDKDYCWPSHSTLAKNMDCSLSSVKTYLVQLVKRGLVAISDTNHRVKSCTYHLLCPTPSTCSQNLGTPPVNSGYNLNLNESINTPPLAPKSVPSTVPCHSGASLHRRGRFLAENFAFEAFYAAYPRKEGKELARSVWYSLARSRALPSLDVLQVALTLAVSSEAWQKEGGRYIPMPSNYLRGHRWMDAPAIVPVQAVEVPPKALVAFEQREQAQKQSERQRCAEMRPAFEALSGKFCSGVNSMAFGIWSLLHDKGIAPTENDVPATTEGMNFVHWLNDYRLNFAYAR